MKKPIIILIILLALVIGYILGLFFPLSIFGLSNSQHPFSLPILEDTGIEGDARLEVSLIMDNGRPLDNVEVDLAEVPGPPPIGGVGLTNEDGLAVFSVKPGSYFIFFNSNNFPKNVNCPEPIAIEVKEGIVNEKEIILTIK